MVARFYVRGEQFDEQGMYVDNDYETLYGTVPTEHDDLAKARAAVLDLRSTGDWPDGRPRYWVEDEDGAEVETDWEELEQTILLAADLLAW